MKSNKTIRPEFSSSIGHWCLVVLNFSNKTATYIDSLGKNNSFVDFSSLERFSIRIMNAINVLRSEPIRNLTRNLEYLHTQGISLNTRIALFEKKIRSTIK